MNQNGDLYLVGQKLLGKKITLLHQDRYIFQQAINLCDRNGAEIYVGDYLEAAVSDDRVVEGLVTFAEEIGSFVILSFKTDEYFVLSQSVMQYTKIVGNVFDDLKKGNKNGE